VTPAETVVSRIDVGRDVSESGTAAFTSLVGVNHMEERRRAAKKLFSLLLLKILFFSSTHSPTL
jgi:hypothetical protein